MAITLVFKRVQFVEREGWLAEGGREAVVLAVGLHWRS